MIDFKKMYGKAQYNTWATIIKHEDATNMRLIVQTMYNVEGYTISCVPTFIVCGDTATILQAVNECEIDEVEIYIEYEDDDRYYIDTFNPQQDKNNRDIINELITILDEKDIRKVYEKYNQGVR